MKKEAIDILTECTSSRGTCISTGITIPPLEEGVTCPLVIMMDGYMGNRDADGLFHGGIGNCVGIAEQLSDLGFASVRLDFPGCGDSKEPFSSYTIANMLSDIETVYQHVTTNYPIDLTRIGTCCWSNGGRIVSLFTETHPEVKTMVLWAPVAANGDSMWPHIVSVLGPKFPAMGISEEDYYLQLWNTAKEEGTAKITLPDGTEDVASLSLDFFEGNKVAKPLDALQNFKGDVLMLVAGKDTCVNHSVFEEIIDHTNVDWVVLDRADHDFGAATQNDRIIKIVQDLSVSFLNLKL